MSKLVIVEEDEKHRKDAEDYFSFLRLSMARHLDSSLEEVSPVILSNVSEAWSHILDIDRAMNYYSPHGSLRISDLYGLIISPSSSDSRNIDGPRYKWYPNIPNMGFDLAATVSNYGIPFLLNFKEKHNDQQCLETYGAAYVLADSLEWTKVFSPNGINKNWEESFIAIREMRRIKASLLERNLTEVTLVDDHGGVYDSEDSQSSSAVSIRVKRNLHSTDHLAFIVSLQPSGSDRELRPVVTRID